MDSLTAPSYDRLLLPGLDISKNWDVDLSKFLQDYIQYLSNTGQIDVNFPQAALLVQNSANIYGKKVDGLYSFIQAVLDNFNKNRKNSKNNEEDEETSQAPTADKGKRKKKTTAVEDIVFELDDDLGTHKAPDDDMFFKLDEELEPVIPESIVFNVIGYQKPKSRHPIEILDGNDEVIGNKDDFRLFRHFGIKGALCDMISPEDFEEVDDDENADTSIVSDCRENSFDDGFDDPENNSGPVPVIDNMDGNEEPPISESFCDQNARLSRCVSFHKKEFERITFNLEWFAKGIKI
uniref:Condensin II complex subunit H2 N-terminal domain-containing protein n=1 Tax=Clastoptera arizonana TaxID=38151 RepID=A0A1B6E1W3_9HEMI